MLRRLSSFPRPAYHRRFFGGWAKFVTVCWLAHWLWGCAGNCWEREATTLTTRHCCSTHAHCLETACQNAATLPEKFVAAAENLNAVAVIAMAAPIFSLSTISTTERRNLSPPPLPKLFRHYHIWRI